MPVAYHLEEFKAQINRKKQGYVLIGQKIPLFDRS